MRPIATPIFASFLFLFATCGSLQHLAMAQVEPPVTPPPSGGNASGDDDDDGGSGSNGGNTQPTGGAPSNTPAPLDPEKESLKVDFLGSIEEALSLMQRRNKQEAIVVYFGDRKYSLQYPGDMATEDLHTLQEKHGAEFVRIDLDPAKAGTDKLFSRILGLTSLPAVVTLDWNANPVCKTEGRNLRTDQIAKSAKNIATERAKLEQRVADAVLTARERIAKKDTTSKKVQAIYTYRFMTGFNAVKDALAVIDELNEVCKSEYNKVARVCQLTGEVKPEQLKHLRQLAADYWGTPMAAKIRVWLKEHEQEWTK